MRHICNDRVTILYIACGKSAYFSPDHQPAAVTLATTTQLLPPRHSSHRSPPPAPSRRPHRPVGLPDLVASPEEEEHHAGGGEDDHSTDGERRSQRGPAAIVRVRVVSFRGAHQRPAVGLDGIQDRHTGQVLRQSAPGDTDRVTVGSQGHNGGNWDCSEAVVTDVIAEQAELSWEGH